MVTQWGGAGVSDAAAAGRQRGGRHRAPSKGAGRLVRLGAIGLVLALGAGAAWWGLSRDEDPVAAAPTCGAERVPLAITASPAVAKTLSQAAKSFDAGVASLVDGRCTTTTVTSAEPADFGDVLHNALEAGGGAGAPTAWVPDASVWREVLARRPELSSALPRAFPVVAVSPVVVAAARPMAEALGWPKAQPSWAELLDLARGSWGAHGHPEWGRVQLAWRDPLQDAAGLASTISMSTQVVRDAETVDEVRRSLLGAHSAIARLNADAQNVFAPLKESTNQSLAGTPLVPATEREVNAFNATSPTVPLAALYPRDGVQPVEVPLITVHADWVTDHQRAALDRFAEFLVTGERAASFAAEGWRTPQLSEATVNVVGAVAGEPAYSPAGPSTTTVAQTLQRWSALDRAGSVLVVLDISGSMNERVPAANNATRLDLAKQSITQSLPLFSDRTAVGLWTFSRHEGRADHSVVLELGPLSRTTGGATAREALQQAVARVRADGATGLYDTVIAAAAAAQGAWREGDNTIVLISDGKNEDPGSANLKQVLDKVAALKNPQRPVRILSIALGDAADANALRSISKATNGETYVARKAEDLDKVFLTALTE